MALSSSLQPEELEAEAVLWMRRMLHGLGDATSPRQDSVTFLLGALREQIGALLSQLDAGGKGPHLTETAILGLVRDRPAALDCLMRSVQVGELARSAEDGGPEVEEGSHKQLRRVYEQELARRGATGSLCGENGPRLARLERYTRAMTPDQYREFAEARALKGCKLARPRHFLAWARPQPETKKRRRSLSAAGPGARGKRSRCEEAGSVDLDLEPAGAAESKKELVGFAKWRAVLQEEDAKPSDLEALRRQAGRKKPRGEARDPAAVEVKKEAAEEGGSQPLDASCVEVEEEAGGEEEEVTVAQRNVGTETLAPEVDGDGAGDLALMKCFGCGVEAPGESPVAAASFENGATAGGGPEAENAKENVEPADGREEAGSDEEGGEAEEEDEEEEGGGDDAEEGAGKNDESGMREDGEGGDERPAEDGGEGEGDEERREGDEEEDQGDEERREDEDEEEEAEDEEEEEEDREEREKSPPIARRLRSRRSCSSSNPLPGPSRSPETPKTPLQPHIDTSCGKFDSSPVVTLSRCATKAVPVLSSSPSNDSAAAVSPASSSGAFKMPPVAFESPPPTRSSDKARREGSSEDSSGKRSAGASRGASSSPSPSPAIASPSRAAAASNVPRSSHAAERMLYALSCDFIGRVVDAVFAAREAQWPARAVENVTLFHSHIQKHELEAAVAKVQFLGPEEPPPPPPPAPPQPLVVKSSPSTDSRREVLASKQAELLASLEREATGERGPNFTEAILSAVGTQLPEAASNVAELCDREGPVLRPLLAQALVNIPSNARRLTLLRTLNEVSRDETNEPGAVHKILTTLNALKEKTGRLKLVSTLEAMVRSKKTQQVQKDASKA